MNRSAFGTAQTFVITWKGLLHRSFTHRGNFPLTISNKLSAGMLLLAVMIGAPAHAFTQESSDPIKIVDNDWSSQKVLARVAQHFLVKMGYETKIIPCDTEGQYADMGFGELCWNAVEWEKKKKAITNKVMQ